MTPEQRAEKIVLHIADGGYGPVIDVQYLAAQIEEAERELKDKAYEDGLSHGFKDGFWVAKEKAKGIILSECGNGCTEDHKKYIADRIGKMEI